MLLDKMIAIYRACVKIPMVLLRNIPLTDLAADGKFRQVTKYLEAYRRRSRFDRLDGQAALREVSLGELFGIEIEQIQAPYGTIDEGTGKPNQAEHFFVNVIARHLKAKNIFEFGTYRGRTTYYLTFASEEANVTTLDLPRDRDPKIPNTGHYFIGSDRQSRIQQILCDSREFDPSPFRKKMDFIFVDGDHSYEGVKNDTEKAFEMLAPNGVILWHDYGIRRPLGLVEYIVELTQQVPLFRIKKTSLLLFVDGVNPMNYDSVK